MRETQRSTEARKRDAGTPGMRLRICVLGPFDIAWQGSDTPFPKERLTGRGAAPALGLLKALMSQPDRFATRDWLLEQFWPESAVSSAQARLDDVASGLRSLLRPPGTTAKWLHYVYSAQGRGSGYRLEGYPMIWVDADAFSWCIEQAARLERFGHDALPLWEQAYHLGSRGQFLPEEIYSDWARARREELAGQYQQCVHRLTTMLREQGATGLALLRLRTHWQANPTDEDALRSLMEVLGEQECFQEAEQYYFQARDALKRERKKLDHRTEELFESIHIRPIQRKKEREYAIAAQSTAYLPLSTGYDPFSFAPPELVLSPEGFPDQTVEQLSTLMDSSTNKEFLSSPFLELQKALSPIVGTHLSAKDQKESILSRRQALLSIAALTMPLFASSGERLSRMSIDVLLSSLEMSIQSCWQLSNEFDILAVSSALSLYLPPLVTITKQSSFHRKSAAHLAAQAFLLQAIVGRHIAGLRAAETSCHEAVIYSQIAEDPILHLTTLRHLAMIYYYAKRHREELALYQHMNTFLSHHVVPPLLQSFVYAGWAGAQALHGQQQEAQTSLTLARETFSLQPATEVPLFYIDYDYSQLFISEGLTYYDLGCYQEALKSFLQVDGLSPKVPVAERGRLEFLNCQARTVLRLPNRDREMQQCIDYWTAAIQGAVTLKSKQRYDEACQIYELMKFIWPHEEKIKTLQEMIEK